MPIKLFDLGELQVTSKNSKQSLFLAISVTLDIPTAIGEQISPADLADMTKIGRLWIAKATTCRLEVAPSVQGVELHGPDASSTLAQYMVDAIGGCTIWEDLSLKLRKEPSKTADEAQQDTFTSFIVNHPDLSSDFLSPKDIPCAKLLTVTCDICFGSRPRKKPTKKPAKRRKIEEPERSRVQGPYGLRHKPTPSKRAEGCDTDEEDEDERNRAGKRRGRASTLENARPVPETQDAAQNTQDGGTGLHGEALHGDVVLLTKAAFSKLLGVKKTTQGVRVVRDLPGPSLIGIAPAVFNIRYLQAFSSRAEHIPWIASCLSGLDAESPTLRAKIRSLAEGNSDRGPAAELEKRLHMLVQRGLDVPPVAPARRGTKAKVSVPVDDASQQAENVSQQSEPALEQESLEFWDQDDGELLGQEVTVDDSQQQLDVPDDEPPDSWHYSQQPGHEWLDLSQASFILDENGQPIAFEDLDHDEHSYQLVPLEDD
ncbi:hypothetical protein CONLIGDRAFT_671111 [Coniochaeta ligniaria NRRL 30616]|uniref:Uncharacterized protein n=1 Tax=Coniochaeta ligniaria NRRL 30616 TaxID=1408157 RepID=A0A1J7JC10_9PEZI|nr:hypothetical protein CONLIGDRAFT_671111 [Coniochaeta ligniaria NRRL 30616]